MESASKYLSTLEQKKDLAQVTVDREKAKQLLQFLVFQVGNGFYGINILETHEILKPGLVTRIPNVESDILGVLNLRGNIIPVVDVNKKFLSRKVEITNFSRIIVAAYQGKYMGLVVDRVLEVARISENSIEGTEVRGLSHQFVKGVGRSDQRIFLLLNLDKMFIEDSES